MNMEFSKVYIVDFKDINKPIESRDMYAEIVLIDRSHPAVQPLLYQLTHESMPSSDKSGFRHDLVTMSRDAFREIGPIASIDRRNKQIRMENQSTVTYKYLIIANGAHQTVTGGLQTLFDALRVQTLPAFDVFEKEGVLLENLKMSNFKVEQVNENDSGKGMGRKLLKAMVQTQTSEINNQAKIYEVQL